MTRAVAASTSSEGTPIRDLVSQSRFPHQKLLRQWSRKDDIASRSVGNLLAKLNLAFRYASHLIVMNDGQIVAEGAPEDIVSSELIEQIYNISCLCIPDRVNGRPMIVSLDD